MTKSIVTQKKIEFIGNLLNFIKNTRDRICYISMSKSYDYIKNEINDRGIYGNIFFIDCISKSLFVDVADTTDCIYFKVPADLKEFSKELAILTKVAKRLRTDPIEMLRRAAADPKIPPLVVQMFQGEGDIRMTALRLYGKAVLAGLKK